jgi:hypothetical protein
LDIPVTIEIRKNGPAKQTHTNAGGDRAVIDDHGYRVRISIDVDYNRIGGVQITHRHKAIRELVDGALDIASDLRGGNGALIDVDDLEPALPLDIEMDTNHQ